MPNDLIELGKQIGFYGHLLNIVLFGTWLGIVVTQRRYHNRLATALFIAYLLCSILSTIFAVLGANYFGVIALEWAQFTFRSTRLFGGLCAVGVTVLYLWGKTGRVQARAKNGQAVGIAEVSIR